MEARKLVLGSGLPYRATLLKRLGLPFICRVPRIDEHHEAGETPADYVLRLAGEKARAAGTGNGDELIIGADQIGCIGDVVLGKPGTVAAARRQLAMLSGQRVSFLVGLALHDPHLGHTTTRLEWCNAHFRELTGIEIARYVASDEPLDCAGSIRVEQRGITLLRRLEGDGPNTLIGLPLIALCEMLRDAGMALP